MNDETEFFTLVFKGNLKKFKGNPLKTETPFGIPFVCALGDLSERIDYLEAKLETLQDNARNCGDER